MPLMGNLLLSIFLIKIIINDTHQHKQWDWCKELKELLYFDPLHRLGCVCYIIFVMENYSKNGVMVDKILENKNCRNVQFVGKM